jgi:reductive dehalogenase
MHQKKMPIRDLAGCTINDYEQKLYDQLLPYDWDDIYLSFKEEMLMFQNVVHLIKNTPEDRLPAIGNCEPGQYVPLMKTLERIYDSIKRLEAPAEHPAQPPEEKVPVNVKVKACAQSQGIHLTGFTTLEPSWVFPASDNWTFPQTHQPIGYTNVIALGMEMNPAVFSSNHSPGVETLFEALLTYAKLGEAVEKITGFIRELGYQARGHHPYAGDFLYSAHAVKAGVGQLGANGLVLTQKYGPRQRFAAITTDAPITVTKPRNLGVNDLCYKCMRCVTTCPTGALSPGKVNWRGTVKWKLNHKRCWKYFIANNGCGLCLIVCPWNKEDSWYHRLAATGVTRSGLFRRMILTIDNLFYWRGAATNPRNGTVKPQEGPVSFAAMLEIMGKENQKET